MHFFGAHQKTRNIVQGGSVLKNTKKHLFLTYFGGCENEKPPHAPAHTPNLTLLKTAKNAKHGRKFICIFGERDRGWISPYRWASLFYLRNGLLPLFLVGAHSKLHILYPPDTFRTPTRGGDLLKQTGTQGAGGRKKTRKNTFFWV